MTSELLDNRYNILSSLGQGGFGETFLAEDTQMPSRRRCVIKQLKTNADKPEIVQLVRDRFSREAAILESVGEHPQIPTLYAYLVRDDRFYLIQEWIQGQTLTQLLGQRGALSTAEVTALLQQLLPVLSYVHDRGLIHRDIKPDNVIIRQRDGLPVLIDFGAVRETMGTRYNDVGQTTSSIVIGTPGFMPSEQAVGRPVFSSDLYALGLTAIYLLSGRYPQDLPTDPRTGEILWHDHAPHCDDRLRDTIDHLIASHPNDRYPSAHAAIGALVAPLAGDGTRPISDLATYPLTHPLTQVPPTIALDSTRPRHTAPLDPAAAPLSVQPSVQPPASIPAPVTDATVAVAPVYNPTVAIPPPRSTPAPQPLRSVPAPDFTDPPTPAPSRFPVNGIVKVALFAGIAGGVAFAGASVFDRSSIGDGSVVDAAGQTINLREMGAANTPESFYFLADSAFWDDYANAANNRVAALQQEGYRDAGWFWVPQYGNLSGEPAAQVFAKRFNRREPCVKLLETYGQSMSDAYCAFASVDPAADNQLINARSVIAQAQQAAPPTPEPAPAPAPIQLPDITLRNPVAAPQASPQTLPQQPTEPETLPETLPNGDDALERLPEIVDNVRGLLGGPSPIETTEKYFKQISRGNYDRSWEMLAPSYQQDTSLHPSGFESYTDWWGQQVEAVDVLETRLVSETEKEAQVETLLRYTMADGHTIDESMTLVWVREGNRWLCVGTR